MGVNGNWLGIDWFLELHGTLSILELIEPKV